MIYAKCFVCSRKANKLAQLSLDAMNIQKLRLSKYFAVCIMRKDGKYVFKTKINAVLSLSLEDFMT